MILRLLGQLYENMGYAHGSRKLNGLYEKSIHLTNSINYFKSALKMERKIHYDRPHPNIACLLFCLGDLYSNLSKKKRNELFNKNKTIYYYQSALSMNRLIYANHFHPDVASNLTSLGCFYGRLGEYSQAFDLLTEAYELYNKLLGPDDSNTRRTREHLERAAIKIKEKTVSDTQLTTTSTLPITAKDPNSSVHSRIKELNSSLVIKRDLYNNQPHPNIAEDLIAVGRQYHKFLSDFKKAIEYYQAGYEMFLVTLGVDDRKTDQARASLEDVISSLTFRDNEELIEANEIQKAIERCELALATQKQIYGDQPNPLVANTLLSLGIAWKKLGDHTCGNSYCSSSLVLYQQIYGSQPHADFALALSDLAITCSMLGEHSQAIEHYQSSLAIHKQLSAIHEQLPRRWLSRNESHLAIVSVLNQIGCTYYKLSDYHQAIEYYGSSLTMYKDLYGDWNDEVAMRFVNLGEAYAALNEHCRAIEHYASALAIYQDLCRVYTTRDWNYEIVSVLNSMGISHHSLGEYREAVKLFNSALIIYREIYKNGPHCELVYCLKNLGSSYTKLKDYNQAIEHYESSLIIQKQLINDPLDPEIEKISKILTLLQKWAKEQ